MKNFIIGLLAIAGVIVLIPFIPVIWHIALVFGFCFMCYEIICWVGKKVGGGK